MSFRTTIELALRRVFIFGCLLVWMSNAVLGQCENVEANVVHAANVDVDRLNKEFGAQKQIPDSLKVPVLLA